MSESEKFLTRWSRRKQGTGQPDPPAPVAGTDKPVTDGTAADKVESQPASVEPEPAFDPASLPSLDSIGAMTDIRAFLKPGVPSELRLAALRRAWSADPAIRNFKGLAENDWDFTAPNSMFGFGDLDASVDVKEMLAQMFDETRRKDETPTEIPAPERQFTPPSQELGTSSKSMMCDPPSDAAHDSEPPDPECTATVGKKAMVQRDENIASHDNNSEFGDAAVKRRRSHGRALPE